MIDWRSECACSEMIMDRLCPWLPVCCSLVLACLLYLSPFAVTVSPAWQNLSIPFSFLVIPIMSDSANQPMSAQACYSKRNTFKESARIVEHVQAKGSRGELLIHLDYLKSFFEKASSWHQKAVSCSGNSSKKNARQWETKLNADYARYHDSANTYLAVTEQDSCISSGSRSSRFARSSFYSAIGPSSVKHHSRRTSPCRC
jgi:hypothetical protein